MPKSKEGVRYILVCFDVFSKCIKLYALKSATAKICLNKLVNHNLGTVINNNIIYLLQLGCYPVAVVILHVNKHEIGYY